MTIPLSSLTWTPAAGATQNLATSDLTVGTPFLRIGLSVNTDKSNIYQIDNFRLVTLVSGAAGVPEPGCLGLLAAATGLAAARRRSAFVKPRL